MRLKGRYWRWAVPIVTVVITSCANMPSAAAASAGSGNLGHAYPQAGASEPAPSAGTVSASAYADRGILNYGDAPYEGALTTASLNAPIVGMAATPDGRGYWLVAADGGVFTFGDAAYFGSAGGVNLNAPIVGMAATPDGKGYWLVALDGGIFTFGDARFYGSMGSIPLNQPIVGMAPTPDGKGYWLVAADGGIFTFGDAPFYGSTGSLTLNAAIVGMAATPDGRGYWLVAADGGIFTFGDAPFEGSKGSANLPASVAGMAATSSGRGYWLVGSNGSVYTFGDAVSYGSNAAALPVEPIAGIVANPATGDGYWLLEPDAFPVNYSHPGGGSAIVAAAASQIEGDPDTGFFCNPYGPCEAWCALFATWAWEAGGVNIPRYAFVGDVYTWAAAHTYVLPPSAIPAPGDAVLYGTGPQNVDTAVHMGIVAQVWRDGAIDTIEGDAGPGAYGHYNVIMNGPFLATRSTSYNGVPVFAFAAP